MEQSHNPATALHSLGHGTGSPEVVAKTNIQVNKQEYMTGIAKPSPKSFTVSDD